MKVKNIKLSPGLIKSLWIRRTDDFINPKKASFFIKVINENGEAADFWNDYFLSSEEMRDIKIDKILK